MLPIYSDKDIKNFLRRMYRFWENNPEKVKFKNMRDTHGLCWFIVENDEEHGEMVYTDVIELSPKGELIPTIIHEHIHHFYPFLSETNVIKVEKYVMKHMSARQIKSIMKKFGETVCY